jgi:HD superfamily phosphodiesterase
MAIASNAEAIRSLFPEVDQIEDKSLRQGVINIWLDIGKESSFTRFEDIPKNLGSEKNRRLTDHVRAMTLMALSLADIGEREQGAKYNRDHLIAACLLHDVSKAVEVEPDPNATQTGGKVVAAIKSEIGHALQHAAYATHKVLAHGLPLDVAHLVLTHTPASNLRPKTLESAYLLYADLAETDLGTLASGGIPWVAKLKVE